MLRELSFREAVCSGRRTNSIGRRSRRPGPNGRTHAYCQPDSGGFDKPRSMHVFDNAPPVRLPATIPRTTAYESPRCTYRTVVLDISWSHLWPSRFRSDAGNFQPRCYTDPQAAKKVPPFQRLSENSLFLRSMHGPTSVLTIPDRGA